MASRTPAFSACRRRKVGETSSVPEDITCGKYIQPQLLIDSSREQELQLDDRESVRELHRSVLQQVDTSKVEIILGSNRKDNA